MTAADVLAVTKAAVETSAVVPVFEVGQEPANRPADYLELDLSRRFGGQLRLGGKSGVVGYRLTVRAVSQTSVSNVRDDLETARGALEYRSLAVSGGRTTPIQFETEDPAAYDDGWFSGLQSYTLTL